jgi:phosphoenolpyruvate synthase/pyruvate phosphate dikinase
MAAQTATLPVPDYFKFEWDSPEEATQFWLVDQMHWPHGVSPMSQVEENPIAIKFFGAQPEQSADPRLISGIAASGGKVTATARVVPSLDEAERLRGGEVLVCPATMPPWTPLFSLASALVTDHGGVLSHTAIVAREYGLPAVVGTKVGTSLIRDGQKVTVDGDAGTVKLED